MPPKKKSEDKISDKERMRIKRANVSKEETETERKKAKKRMAKNRKQMSDSKKE